MPAANLKKAASVQPSREEWAFVEERLEQFHRSVDFEIDGYRVSFILVRIQTYRNAIAIYVDDVFKGKWLADKTEEARRFFPRRERYVWSAKHRKSRVVVRAMGKERANAKIVQYMPFWTSFRSLKRHLIANNDRIVLTTAVEPETP